MHVTINELITTIYKSPSLSINSYFNTVIHGFTNINETWHNTLQSYITTRPIIGLSCVQCQLLHTYRLIDILYLYC